MSYFDKYCLGVKELIEKLHDSSEVYKKAAEILAEAVKNKRLVHVLGTEMHSSIAVEDVFFRQGSLLNINPMFDPSFSVTHSASRSLYLKEAEGCGEFLVEYYRNIGEGDVLIVVDNDGIGKGCYEAVKKGKELGMKVIAITSSSFASAVGDKCTFRNNQKINLCDMKEVDIVIDNSVLPYDAVVETEKLGIKSGWLSTIANSFILNALTLFTLETIEKEEVEADVFDSFYTREGFDKNEKLIEKYFDKVKHI